MVKNISINALTLHSRWDENEWRTVHNTMGHTESGWGWEVLSATGPGLPVHPLHGTVWALSCGPPGARGNSHHHLHQNQSLNLSQTHQISGALCRCSSLQEEGREGRDGGTSWEGHISQCLWCGLTFGLLLSQVLVVHHGLVPLDFLAVLGLVKLEDQRLLRPRNTRDD